MRINNNPDVDLPFVVVTAVRPGSAPSELETQVTRLIEVNRAYDSISKMMADTSDLSRRSIERIGKLN